MSYCVSCCVSDCVTRFVSGCVSECVSGCVSDWSGPVMICPLALANSHSSPMEDTYRLFLSDRLAKLSMSAPRCHSSIKKYSIEQTKNKPVLNFLQGFSNKRPLVPLLVVLKVVYFETTCIYKPTNNSTFPPRQDNQASNKLINYPTM